LEPPAEIISRCWSETNTAEMISIRGTTNLREEIAEKWTTEGNDLAAVR
jgi:hypothetical protein